MTDARRSLFVCFSALAISGPVNCQEGEPSAGRLVDLGGYSLHYQRVGDGDRPVVFIHGGGDALGVWSRVVEEMPPEVVSISFDSHGRGYSDWGPRTRTNRQIAHDFRAVLSAEDISGPFVLVGHSLGGLIAQYFAHAFPSDVAGLLLVDPTPLDRLGRYERDDGSSYFARDRDFARAISVPPLHQIGTVLEEATEEFVRTNDYSNFGGLLGPDEIRTLEEATNHPRLRPPGAELNEYWAEELRDLYQMQRPGWLGSIPVRLIHAPSDYSDFPDEWFSTDTYTKATARETTLRSLHSYLDMSTAAREVEVNTGHHIQIERPNLVVELVREVLTLSKGGIGVR